MFEKPPETCRLCWSNGAGYLPGVKCFGEAPSNVAKVLQQHFSIEMQLHPERDASAFVCRSCWHIVSSFHRFYQFVLDAREGRAQSEDDLELIEIIEGNEGDDDDDELWKAASPEASGGSKTKSDTDLVKLDKEGVDGMEHTIAIAAFEIKSEPMLLDEYPFRVPDAASAADVDPIAMEAPAEPESSEDEAALIRRFVPMRCEFCDNQFETFEALCRHLERKHHFVGYVKCCAQTFATRAEVLQHCRKHRDELAQRVAGENPQQADDDVDCPEARESPGLQLGRPSTPSPSPADDRHSDSDDPTRPALRQKPKERPRQRKLDAVGDSVKLTTSGYIFTAGRRLKSRLLYSQIEEQLYRRCNSYDCHDRYLCVVPMCGVSLSVGKPCGNVRALGSRRIHRHPSNREKMIIDRFMEEVKLRCVTGDVGGGGYETIFKAVALDHPEAASIVEYSRAKGTFDKCIQRRKLSGNSGLQ